MYMDNNKIQYKDIIYNIKLNPLRRAKSNFIVETVIAEMLCMSVT